MTAEAPIDQLRSRSEVPAEAALGFLGEIAARHRLTDIGRRCATAREQARSGVLNVALLGSFKAGKTTVLNQLLGTDLLPVQAIPATAVITRARFAATPTIRVVRTAGDVLDVAADELADWITETGNPGNRLGVASAEVTSPGLDDLADLVFVDTPGTGSSWQHNTETSLGWLPNVGAAIVAVSSTQPLAESDVRLLELVRRHTPEVMVLLTKADLLAEGDLAQVIRHVREQLLHGLGMAPPILPISIAARHRHHRDQFRSWLRELRRNHAAAATRLAEHRISRLVGECSAYLELARAAATSHAGAIRQLRAALDAEQSRLPSLRRQEIVALRPVARALNELAQRSLAPALPRLVAQLGRDLDASLPRWRGSLAAETRRFRSWLSASMVAALTPLAARTAAELDPLAREGLTGAERTGEAFTHWLAQLVSTATGSELRLPTPQLHRLAAPPADVVVDAVFDSHLELLSWAIPMWLARPAVHRHFRGLLPWQVEKNLYRTAYATAAAAVRGLELSVEAYLDSLLEQLDTCRHLIALESGGLEDLARDQAALSELGERFPSAPVATGPLDVIGSAPVPIQRCGWV